MSGIESTLLFKLLATDAVMITALLVFLRVVDPVVSDKGEKAITWLFYGLVTKGVTES